jgi:putative inorganic carbon (HCO3(-)) transporter
MLLLPLLLGCAAGCWQSGRRVLAGALLLAALPALLTLVLTRSRAGWMGLAAATLALLLAFVWLKSGPRGRKALIVAVALAFSIAVILAAVGLPRFLASAEAGATIATPDDAALTLEARAEIWSRALYALQDFPFTGVGLGAFRRVVNVLYPLFLVPPDADIAHSHNMFLQVGVDLGLIGLVGYGALLLIAGVTTWQVASHADGFERYIALGALGAVVGLHVYGLADALALGSKPSVVFWIVLGLAAALPRMRQAGSQLALLP